MFNWTKAIHLVRGLPGEGKSTLALKLMNGDFNRVVENDDFWMVPKDRSVPHHIKGRGPYLHRENLSAYEYRYQLSMTHLAANWCGAEVFRRLRIFDSIAVANTFVKREHIVMYVDEARKHQIRVILHRPETAWSGNSVACSAKSIHNVPLDRVEKMKDQWEEMTQAEVDILLNLPMEMRK